MIKARPIYPILITALAFVCLHWPEARAQDVDMTDPANIKAYRDGFRLGAHKRCMLDVEQRLTAEGKEFGAHQRNVAEKFCTCTVENISALIADDQIESLKTVMVEPSLKPQRQQIVVECARSTDTTSN
jgi:hypothetical protein